MDPTLIKMFKAFIKIIIIFLFCSQVSARTITIAADTWFPINGDPESATPGYMIELATLILAHSGHRVDYKVMPWKRAVLLTRKGDIDCVVGAYKTDTRDFIFPETHWGLDNPSFYVAKNEAWKYEGPKSLDKISFGVIGGYLYGEPIDSYVQANELENVFVSKGEDGLEQNIKKILLGRMTATLESELVMQAKLKEMSLAGELVNAGPLGDPVPMYIACSPLKPFSQSIVDQVDAGTKELRESGALEELMNKYGLTDWEQ